MKRVLAVSFIMMTVLAIISFVPSWIYLIAGIIVTLIGNFFI